jgi:hypothetical protein
VNMSESIRPQERQFLCRCLLLACFRVFSLNRVCGSFTFLEIKVQELLSLNELLSFVSLRSFVEFSSIFKQLSLQARPGMRDLVLVDDMNRKRRIPSHGRQISCTSLFFVHSVRCRMTLTTRFRAWQGDGVLVLKCIRMRGSCELALIWPVI